jgi:outer membrane protein
MVLFCTVSSGQDKWDLRKIVEYAMTNNINVRQAAVQAEISQLLYKQSKLALYPNAAFNANTGFNNGRNQDPTSFNLITQSYTSAGMQLQTSIDIFNWYSKKIPSLPISGSWKLPGLILKN